MIRSPLSVLSVDCTLSAAGAVISAPATSPALGSPGLALLIDTELAGAAEPVGGVTVGVGAVVGAGAAIAAPGDGAVVEAEFAASAGGGFEFDEEVAACVEDTAGPEDTELEEVSEVVACGAGLLTVAVVAGA